jgi:hypothetical protein
MVAIMWSISDLIINTRHRHAANVKWRLAYHLLHRQTRIQRVSWLRAMRTFAMKIESVQAALCAKTDGGHRLDAKQRLHSRQQPQWLHQITLHLEREKSSSLQDLCFPV